MSTPKVTYGNGQNIYSDSGQLNGYEVDFAGTSQLTEPFLTITGNLPPAAPYASTTLSSVEVHGSSSHALAYGSLGFSPLSAGVITNGIHMSYGDLTLNQQMAKVTLGGTSIVNNDSTLTVLGGRYHAARYTLNGTVFVGNGSTVNAEEALFSGGGSINLNAATATVDLKTADTSIQVNINSGMLSLKDGMSFLGTIHEAAAGTTKIFNTLDAVKETFNQSTGVLDLLNSAGANVASVRFTGSATLYATRDLVTGAMDITNTHQTGSLPVVFSHGLAADASGIGTDITIDAAPTPAVTPTPPPSSTPPAAITAFDTTTNQPLGAVGQVYTGPVSGLQNEYANLTSDSLNIDATTDNWFIHSGAGTDAIAVHGGTNVLDGGTGSNFLTGGSGTDTFFVDDRGPTADIWSTVVGFHAGDAATIWGVTPQDFAFAWADGQGAAGFTGLTLHATAGGRPTASLTLAGYTQADMSDGRLSVSFGNDPASGSAYMYVHGNS
jgi:hypothetical protein